MSVVKEEKAGREVVTYRWPDDTSNQHVNDKVDDLNKVTHFDYSSYNNELSLTEDTSLGVHVNVKTKAKKEPPKSNLSAKLILFAFRNAPESTEHHSLLNDPNKKCQRCLAIEAHKVVDDPVAAYVNALGHDCEVYDKYDMLNECRV